MVSVSLKNVCVEFPVHMDKKQSLRQKLLEIGSVGRIKLANDRNRAIVNSLQNISFSAKPGDRIGLIGANGAGKTTLLKTLGGMCAPTHGEMIVDGNTTTLMSSSAMIDPMRTGYENIRYMGMLLGFSKERVNALIPEIEEFTELGDHLDLPVKTYSAGMKVRLSFAVLTAVQTDILLIDEVIGVGDTKFIEKAQERAFQLYERSEILFLASHSKPIIERICNRVLFMADGEILFDGPPAEGFAAYRKHREG